MKVFVIDVAKCNGCHNCQIACKDEHCSNDWTPYATSQPMTGHFWMKVNQEERGSTPKVRVAYLPVLCQHCADAPCMDVCQEAGALYRRDDGLVIIDPQKCTGCMSCVTACPYGVIFENKESNIAQKCTGCAHLLDEGWEVPRCVDACTTGALQFGEEEDFGELLENAEFLHPEFGTSPKVYYLNMPKKFIAGTVYDPIEKEVVIGAICKLTSDSGNCFEVKTDGFGDFWFEDIEEGSYSLDIMAEGFKVREFSEISTELDVNLGDIAMVV